MRASDERILTTHVGSIPRSAALRALLVRQDRGEAVDEGALAREADAAVREVVRRAGAAGVPVYPISTGRNWGYGDACAPVGGCVLLELSRMDRIVEVNVPLAYAVVEPGVTQGQLARHLEESGLPLVLDATGAGPDTSIIGNVAERGFGHTAYGDRFAHALCFEAVLADGSVVTTGFGSYEGARAAHLYKWGIGPVLDGVLTQSSLAVITTSSPGCSGKR